MKRLLVLLAGIGFAVAAGAQPVTAPKMNVLADSATRTSDRAELHGHVRIAACSIVTADEAVIHTLTNDVDLTGTVRMKLTDGIDPLRD
jgi:hypothetical protein